MTKSKEVKPMETKEQECEHLLAPEVHDFQKCSKCGLSLKDILARERLIGWQEATAWFKRAEKEISNG